MFCTFYEFLTFQSLWTKLLDQFIQDFKNMWFRPEVTPCPFWARPNFLLPRLKNKPKQERVAAMSPHPLCWIFTQGQTKWKPSPVPQFQIWAKIPFLENRNFPLDPVKTYKLIFFLGIHVVYDLSRNPGNRVVTVDVLCTQCRVPSYEPLKMDEVYKVVLSSFLANGGDGYQMIKDEALQHDSGKHSVLSISQRYSRTTKLIQRRELVTHDARRAKPKTRAWLHGADSLFVGNRQLGIGGTCALSLPGTHTHPSKC